MSTTALVPLVQRAIDAMKQAAAGDAVAAATQAAEALEILEVQDEADAQIIADCTRTIGLGRKALKEQLAKITRPIDEAKKAATDMAKPHLMRFDAAEAKAKGGFLAWQVRERARVAREQAEAAVAARRDAEVARVEQDDPDLPALEEEKVEAPRMVSGGIGSLGMQVRTQVRGVVNWHDVDHALLRVDTAAALTLFNTACIRGEATKPGPGAVVVWGGIEFFGNETVVSRGR